MTTSPRPSVLVERERDRLVRAAAALVLIAATLAIGVAPASACTCQPLTESEYVTNADNVFVGTVERHHEARRVEDQTVYVFDVDRVLKGTAAEHQAVATSEQSSACGAEFGAGPRVVFTFDDDTQFELEPGFQATNSCAGSVALEDFTLEIAAIPPEAGDRPPAEAIAAQVGNPRSSLFPEIFIFGGVFVFVIGLTAWLGRSGRTPS